MIHYTAEEFLDRRRDGTLDYVAEAVYLIKNVDKNMFYVGQSIHPHDRVFAHFVGRGNGDVYADFKYGDHFTVRFYAFNPYQFQDLNELERHIIRIYEADVNGYNRQAGNRTRFGEVRHNT